MATRSADQTCKTFSVAGEGHATGCGMLAAADRRPTRYSEADNGQERGRWVAERAVRRCARWPDRWPRRWFCTGDGCGALSTGSGCAERRAGRRWRVEVRVQRREEWRHGWCGSSGARSGGTGGAGCGRSGCGTSGCGRSGCGTSGRGRSGCGHDGSGAAGSEALDDRRDCDVGGRVHVLLCRGDRRLGNDIPCECGGRIDVAMAAVPGDPVERVRRSPDTVCRWPSRHRPCGSRRVGGLVAVAGHREVRRRRGRSPGPHAGPRERRALQLRTARLRSLGRHRGGRRRPARPGR